MTKGHYKSIDLFAGIGGIRMGFDNAFGNGIETVFSCEWDEPAQKTYKANFKDDFGIAGDITKIDEKDIPAFDICLAGFPCQAFSIAGTGGYGRSGFSDDFKGQNRGNLFLDVVRICKHHKPKVIFCENVKGLVQHDRGRTFQVIRNAFKDIGYQVFWKVLSSGLLSSWVSKYLEGGEAALSKRSGNPYAALTTSKKLTEEERLKLIIAKQEVEIARIKKGYFVKGVGAEKEYVTGKEKTTK